MSAATGRLDDRATAQAPAVLAADAGMPAYYRQRAPEYDRVYHRPERQGELRALEAWLGHWFSGRQVLELAAGTGWWTPHGARMARHWLATDLNPETLALARARDLPATAHTAELDAYRPQDASVLAPAGGFDAAFTGCWWSHVPLSRLAGWLQALLALLPEGARIAMLDNRFVPAHSTPLSHRDADGNTWQQRRLDDGSTHAVIKNYPSEAQAALALGPRARHLQLTAFTHYWVLTCTLGPA